MKHDNFMFQFKADAEVYTGSISFVYNDRKEGVAYVAGEDFKVVWDNGFEAWYTAVQVRSNIASGEWRVTEVNFPKAP